MRSQKDKILEILDKYAKDNFGINSTYIDNLEFDELADELVKNCSIPHVVGQSEQLPDDDEYYNPLDDADDPRTMGLKSQ